LKVDFQGSRVTSDGGLILVRELDERLGFGELITQIPSDSRRGKNPQIPLTDLLYFARQSASRIAGYEDVNDTERLSQDPTFRLIGSERIWERGATMTSRLQTFETEMLAEQENFTGMARTSQELFGKAEGVDSPPRPKWKSRLAPAAHSRPGFEAQPAHGVILSIRLVQNTGQVSQFGEEVL
jgi:hypothetical protein